MQDVVDIPCDRSHMSHYRNGEPLREPALDCDSVGPVASLEAGRTQVQSPS